MVTTPPLGNFNSPRFPWKQFEFDTPGLEHRITSVWLQMFSCFVTVIELL